MSTPEPKSTAAQTPKVVEDEEEEDFVKAGLSSLIRGLAVHILDDDVRDIVRGSIVAPLLRMLASQLYPYIMVAGVVVLVLLVMSATTICLLLLGGAGRGQRLFIGGL